MQLYKVRIFQVEKSDTADTAAYAEIEQFLCTGHDLGYCLSQMTMVEMGNYLALAVVLEYQGAAPQKSD